MDLTSGSRVLRDPGVMTRRLGGGVTVALVAFVLVLSAGEAVLKQAHLHWPLPLVAVVGVIPATLLGLVKPLQEAVGEVWTRAFKDRAERATRAEQVLRETAPGHPRVQRVRDLVGRRAVLGIHAAIPLPSGADEALSQELPVYVARDVHARLTTWITAHERSGGLLILVGPAGAGKSRCLFEAVRDKLPDAELLMPHTAAQLNDFAANDGDGPLVV